MHKIKSRRQAMQTAKKLQKQVIHTNKKLTKGQKLLVAQMKCSSFQIKTRQKQHTNSWYPTTDFQCYSNKNSIWQQGKVEQVSEQVSVKRAKVSSSTWHIWQTFCHIQKGILSSNCLETIIMKSYTSKLCWWVSLSSSGMIGLRNSLMTLLLSIGCKVHNPSSARNNLLSAKTSW